MVKIYDDILGALNAAISAVKEDGNAPVEQTERPALDALDKALKKAVKLAKELRNS